MKTYDFKSLFNEVKTWSDENFDEKTKYNRIKKIISFIWTNKMIDKNKHYINHVIRLNELDLDLKNKLKGYKLNIIAYIFLVCICKNYELDFFQDTINNRYSTEEEAEKWFYSIKDTLTEYREFYERESKNNDWEIVEVNLSSIYYSLTKLERNSIDINIIDERIINVLSRMIALPDDEKIKLYNDVVKNRLNYIDKKIEEIVKNMDDSKKRIYNCDLELQRI